MEKENANTTEEKKEQGEFKVEDSVYVDKKVKQPIPKQYRLTVFDVIGGILEFIWFLFKLAVVCSIVIGIVGFLLTRNLMIRGRVGERQCLAGMTVSPAVASNKSKEERRVNEWLRTAKRKKLTLTADDGKILVARTIVVDKDSDNWVVIMHGFNGDMEDIYDIALRYAEKKYNILMPDLRANGESEGSFLGMGWTDRLDVINWIDLILKENPSAEFAIHGIDVGGDTALMMSGEPLKSAIKVIVAEGAYTSAWEVVKKEYEARYDYPTFPIANMMNPVTKIWGGYSLKEADAVKQVKKTAVPILLIHGTNDTYATDDMTKELDQAIASTHQVLEIATGAHEDCRYAEPDTYYDKTFQFVDTYMR